MTTNPEPPFPPLRIELGGLAKFAPPPAPPLPVFAKALAPIELILFVPPFPPGLLELFWVLLRFRRLFKIQGSKKSMINV